MSDEKLRELERRFRETESVEDEVAWLRERARVGEKLDWESYSRLAALDVEAAASCLAWRVQVGDLSQERLELAAYCGHEAARLAVGPSHHDWTTLVLSKGEWRSIAESEATRALLLRALESPEASLAQPAITLKDLSLGDYDMYNALVRAEDLLGRDIDPEEAASLTTLGDFLSLGAETPTDLSACDAAILRQVGASLVRHLLI